jgi:hypothetical protein
LGRNVSLINFFLYIFLKLFFLIFWGYHGAKLYNLSGLISGSYSRMEIMNLARFITNAKVLQLALFTFSFVCADFQCYR